jgi:hypothetical protein
MSVEEMEAAINERMSKRALFTEDMVAPISTTLADFV